MRESTESALRALALVRAVAEQDDEGLRSLHPEPGDDADRVLVALLSLCLVFAKQVAEHEGVTLEQLLEDQQADVLSWHEDEAGEAD